MTYGASAYGENINITNAGGSAEMAYGSGVSGCLWHIAYQCENMAKNNQAAAWRVWLISISEKRNISVLRSKAYHRRMCIMVTWRALAYINVAVARRSEKSA